MGNKTIVSIAVMLIAVTFYLAATNLFPEPSVLDASTDHNNDDNLRTLTPINTNIATNLSSINTQIKKDDKSAQETLSLARIEIEKAKRLLAKSGITLPGIDSAPPLNNAASSSASYRTTQQSIRSALLDLNR